MTLLALALSGLFACGTMQASASEPWSNETLSRWITYYYLKPNPELFDDAMRTMTSAGWLEEGSSTGPMLGFIAGVVRSNPGKLKVWMEEFEKLDDQKLSTVALGIWYAALPESRKAVFSMMEGRTGVNERLNFLQSGTPLKITEIPLEQGSWVLDANWGYFMATGEREPVLRIISALSWLDEGEGAHRILVGGAARWSLMSNAVQHKKVLEICESQAAVQPEDIAKELREIVTAAKDELAKNGPGP
ncbi:MAG: hypothetical protein E6R11_02020 [Rhodocyclaceae bacterium]|nr:MAG: hypothetical protein E6R11_02020 [Rhodocyclaceae bacterium]